jgi:CelD/BcsL family acetyltransferase involved in cellulose biosynthesis
VNAVSQAPHVRVVSRLADIDEREWSALAARAPASLSGSRGWLDAAFATVSRDLEPHLLVAESGGRLDALLPLALDSSGESQALSPGGSPHNDLTDVLVAPGREPAAAAIVDELVAISGRGWSVRLDSLDPDGVLAAAARESGAFAWSEGRASPLVDLRGSWRAAASQRRRQQWDRALRRLRANHRVEFELIEGEEATAALGEFLYVREARLRAKGHPTDRPPIPLVVAAVPRLARQGRCAFAEMRIDGRMVARDLYLLDRGTGFMWLRAFDDAWQRFPCGHLLLRATAERLAAEGYEALDLGRGDEPYKFFFGAANRTLLHASPRAPAY